MGVALGANCYKIRLAIRSKGSGKSGGGRVITAVYAADEKVTLLALYDKSAQSTITDEELRALVALSAGGKL